MSAYFWWEGASSVPTEISAVLGIASETDTAVAIGRKKVKAIGTVTETDTAVAITKKKSRTLGIATETDSARPILPVIDLPFVESWTGPDGAPWPYPWLNVWDDQNPLSEIRSNKGYIGGADDFNYGYVYEQAIHAALLMADAEVVVDITITGGDSASGVLLRSPYPVAPEEWDAPQPGWGYQVLVFAGLDEIGPGTHTWGWFFGSPHQQTVFGTNASFLTGSLVETLRLKFQVVGTTVRFKLWDPTGAEPGTWTDTATDSVTTAAGYLMLWGQGGLDTPWGPSFDNLTLSVPDTSIEQAIATATETDTAGAIGKSKAKAIGIASETDTARIFGKAKVKAIGISSETDTAVAIGRLKKRTIGIASETDTAIAITKSKAKAVTLATETDTAGSFSRLKTKAITLASETDTAGAISTSKVKTVTFAVETDTAIPLGRRKTKIITLAEETDTAPPISEIKLVQVGIASETDTAIVFTHTKMKTISAAAEADSAIALTALKTATIVLAEEFDTAGEITLPSGNYIGVIPI